MIYGNLVASIIKCLKQLLEQDDLTPDSRESMEVSIQCLESAYGVQTSDAVAHFDILQLFKLMLSDSKQNVASEATPDAKAEATRLKNEGNVLIKSEQYEEALSRYSKALDFDSRNAVIYCNRAVVHSKLGNHLEAIKDCQKALSIDPNYVKAYGRMGLAYFSLERYKEARDNYQKALDLEPDNENFKNNLLIIEEKLSLQSSGSATGPNLPTDGLNIDPSSLLGNPALMNMARQMLSDPTMQNMMSNLISGNMEETRMDALIEAGQQLAQQLQNSNPELIESLRRQIDRNQPYTDSPEKKGT